VTGNLRRSGASLLGEAESSHVPEVSFPGAGAVSSADAGRDAGPEVTALYEAHAFSLIRLA